MKRKVLIIDNISVASLPIADKNGILSDDFDVCIAPNTQEVEIYLRAQVDNNPVILFDSMCGYSRPGFVSKVKLILQKNSRLVRIMYSSQSESIGNKIGYKKHDYDRYIQKTGVSSQELRYIIFELLKSKNIS